MIPRVIHHVWVGGPLPDRLAGHVATWQEHHPGWEHRMWCEADIYAIGLRNRAVWDAAEHIAPGSEGQLRSDVARVEILHRIGGLYVDCDMECRRPVDGLLDGRSCVVAREDNRWVNNAFFAAAPGHSLLADLIAAIPGSVAANRGPGVRPNRLTGPHLLTPLVAGRDDVTVLPAETVYPYRWDELSRSGEEFPDAFAVHHWDNARKRLARV